MRQAGKSHRRGQVRRLATPAASASTVCRWSIVSRRKRRRNTSFAWPRRRNWPAIICEAPQRSGDLVLEYRVEGCAPKTLDCFDWTAQHPNQPLYLEFDGARDVDGDGAIEVSAGVTASSRIRHSRLSAIWAFPEGTKIDKPESVISGAMKDKCVRFIDVAQPPSKGWTNQTYGKTDVSFAWMRLDYAETIEPGQTKTYWLRVPPIHRREPVSMGYIAHAFRDVLPGEAVPPFGPEKVKALQELDPQAAERQVVDFWAAFFARRRSSTFPIRFSTTSFFRGWQPGRSSK